MNPYKVKQVSWYGFDHKKVAEQFEGNLTFCAEFCVKGEYLPVAVYKAKNPNTKRGHKKYMLLQMQNEMGLVRGMSAQEMAKERFQDAIICLNCNTILYSINRHHNNYCECKKDPISIDGGKSYTKIGVSSKNYVLCKIDLIEGIVFCEIPLTQDKVAIVDIEDYIVLSKYKWRANNKGGWYAIRSVNRNKEHKTYKMHRQILGITDPKIMIDHINGNGLDNRRCNLRLCDNSQNQANQKPTKRNTSGYRGVQKLPKAYKTKPYKAVILVKGKQHFLGNYKTKTEAAKAYNTAALKFFGEFAKLNQIENKNG